MQIFFAILNNRLMRLIIQNLFEIPDYWPALIDLAYFFGCFDDTELPISLRCVLKTDKHIRLLPDNAQ